MGGRAVLCSSCRKLVAADETRCPHCGASNPTLFGLAPVLRRVLGPVDVSTMVIVACVALYLLSVAVDVPAVLKLRGPMSLGSPSGKALYLFGMTGDLAWSCGHIWTLLTASFLHGGILHIAFNMYWLHSLGPLTVRFLGSSRFFVVFAITGAVGFLASNLFSGAPTIGASASIFGLLGVLFAFGRRRGGTLGEALGRNLLSSAVFLFVFGLAMSGVNNWAHAGGFLSGAAMAWLFPAQEGVRPSRWTVALAVLLALATLAGFALSVLSWWSAVRHGTMPFCLR